MTTPENTIAVLVNYVGATDTKGARIKLTLPVLGKRADPNGAAASMSDLYDGHDPELLADEIERSLANMDA